MPRHMPVASRSGPAGVWRSVHEIADPEQFGEAVAGASLRAEFLGGSGLAARIERFIGTDWAMDFFESGIKARVCGPLLSGWASFCLILRAGESRWYGIAAEDGWLLCNPPGTPIDGTITPGFRGVSIAVPQAVWSSCLSQSRDRESQSFSVVRLPRGTAPRLLRDLQELHRCLSLRTEQCGECQTPARLGANLARRVAQIACEASDAAPPPKHSTRNRFRLARRAESWMRDHLAENPDIPALCCALGTSRRELEYAFHSAFGQSPRAYLESIRLNAVRTALHSTSATVPVSAIAMGYGFHHLGRFSTRFKSFFGENPSRVCRRDDASRSRRHS